MQVFQNLHPRLNRFQITHQYSEYQISLFDLGFYLNVHQKKTLITFWYVVHEISKKDKKRIINFFNQIYKFVMLMIV